MTGLLLRTLSYNYTSRNIIDHCSVAIRSCEAHITRTFSMIVTYLDIEKKCTPRLSTSQSRSNCRIHLQLITNTILQVLQTISKVDVYNYCCESNSVLIKEMQIVRSLYCHGNNTGSYFHACRASNAHKHYSYYI